MSLYFFSASVSHLLLWNCSIIYYLPMCSEVASCTRHSLLQFNMGVSLLFSESNKKRISFHSLKKYGFISSKSKTDPVAVKCHTHSLSYFDFYKPCRVQALREADDQVISAVLVAGLEFLKPACGSWGKSPFGGCKLFLLEIFSHPVNGLWIFCIKAVDFLINIHKTVTHAH